MPVTSPETSFTRHLPHEPLPLQGASMATLAALAASRMVLPGAAEKWTSCAPFSNWKVISYMLSCPFLSRNVWKPPPAEYAERTSAAPCVVPLLYNINKSTAAVKSCGRRKGF